MSYAEHLLLLLCFNVLVAVGANYVTGYLGYLSLLHGGLVGLGAYTCGISFLHLHFPFWAAVLVGGAVTAAFAVLVSQLLCRLDPHRFTIGSLAIQLIVVEALLNLRVLTGGEFGMFLNPQTTGFATSSAVTLIVLVVVIAFVAGTLHYERGSTLRRMILFRDDPELANSAGVSTSRISRIGWLICGSALGAAGGLYLVLTPFLQPGDFGFGRSVFVLTMVFLGGRGNLIGVLVGAILLSLLPEALRVLPLTDARFASARQIAYGLVLIYLALRRPQGLLGARPLFPAIRV